MPTFDGCHFHLALAQEQAAGRSAGDAGGPAQQRSQDAFFLTLRSQLSKKTRPLASARED